MNSLSKCIPAIVLLCALAGCDTPPARDVPRDDSQVHAILEHWINSQGGRAELRKVGVIEYQCSLEVANGTARIPLHIWESTSGPSRNDFVTPGLGTMVQASNGVVGWRQNDRFGFGFVPPAEVLANFQNNASDLPLIVDKFYKERRLLPSEEIGGRRCNVLEMRGQLGAVEHWFFDAESGRLLRKVRPPVPGASVANFQQNVTIEYGEFRKTGRYTLPFLLTMIANGQTFTFHVESIATHDRVPSSLFEPPADLVRDAFRTDEILRQHLESLGGIAIYAQLRSRVTRSEVTVAATGVKMHTISSQKWPNMILNEQEIPGIGHIVQGYDGTTGWASSDLQGYRTLKGPELAQLVDSGNLRGEVELATRFPLRKFLGEKTVAGRRTYLIQLANMQGATGLHYFDAENGRLLRAETSFVTGPGGTIGATVDCSDFRTVDGFVLPFRISINNPAVKLQIEVQSVQNNVPLDDAIFRPRKDG